MPDIEEAFVTYLLADSGLSALISTRLYPDDRPQGDSLPAITYSVISDIKQHVLSGQLSQERPMYQFSIYAATRTSAKAVAAALKTALCDYQGTMSGLVVQRIRLENEIYTKEVSADGVTKTHNADLEFEVIYERS